MEWLDLANVFVRRNLFQQVFQCVYDSVCVTLKLDIMFEHTVLFLIKTQHVNLKPDLPGIDIHPSGRTETLSHTENHNFGWDFAWNANAASFMKWRIVKHWETNVGHCDLIAFKNLLVDLKKVLLQVKKLNVQLLRQI